MPARGSGKFQQAGLSSVRRRYSVLKAVNKYRGRSGETPSWRQYLKSTGKGRRDFGG